MQNKSHKLTHIKKRKHKFRKRLKLRKDIIGNLPPELSLEISLYFTPEDFNNALECSERWKSILDIGYYWMKKCNDKNYPHLDEPIKTKFYEDCVTKCCIFWKGVHNYNELQHNWRHNVFEKKIIKFDDNYLEIFYLDDEIVVAKTDYNSIHIINFNKNTVENQFQLKSGIQGVVKNENFLIILMENIRYLKIYDIKKNKLLVNKELNVAIRDATSIEFYGHIVAIKEFKRDFSLFNMKTQEIFYRNMNVRSMCFQNGYILLGTCFGTVEIFDATNFIKLGTFEYEKGLSIVSIMMQNNFLVTVHKNKDIQNSSHIYVSTFLEPCGSLKKVEKYSIEDTIGVCSCLYSLNHKTLTYCKNTKNPDNTLISQIDFTTKQTTVEFDIENRSIEYVATNIACIFICCDAVQVWCRATRKLVTVINDLLIYRVWKPIIATETKLGYVNEDGAICIHDYNFNIM